MKPPVGKVKLNSDGASRCNPGPSVGGDVIRDSNGNILYAYSSFLGHNSNMVAEARALYQGIIWLSSHGHMGAIVEMDSKVLLDCLTGRASPPWKCWYFIRAILHINESMHFIFQHCYREANQVADSLANLGCDQGADSDYYDLHSLPHHVRGSVILDIQVLPYIRY